MPTLTPDAELEKDPHHQKIVEKGNVTPVEEHAIHDVDAFDAAAKLGGEDQINYRSMGWVKAGALIMAEVCCVFFSPDYRTFTQCL